MAQLLQPFQDTSPSSKNTTARRFADLYQFIPVRKAHLDFLGFMFGEEPPPIAECFGRTMVDVDFMPVGFCLAWLRPKAEPEAPQVITIHAYYGPYLKQWPKDILKGMKPVIDRIRDAGFDTVYAEAEPHTDGSRKLVAWFKGEPIGQFTPRGGEWYRIDLNRTPI